MSEPLVVRLSGQEIGELRPDGSFVWAFDGLERVPFNAPVLSHSLPFGHPGDPAPFFGGLLPEGVGLERLARESGVASNDLYGLLAEVGADVGGGVTIGEPRPPLDPITIEEDEYDRILERAYGYLRGSAVGGGGSSATGVQPKITLTFDPQAERWLIGRGSIPSTHLLKPVPKERAAVLHAEAYLNALARELGLATHAAKVEDAGRTAVLVVERYDRARTSEGAILRIHQEDAAQALGLPWGGNDKYQSVNSRAALRSISRLLDRDRSLFSIGLSDRERLLAITVLNVVAGNTDAHAKNFSLLLPALDGGTTQGWTARLADAYDIVPQSLFEPEQSPLAMSVGGERQPSVITAEHMIEEACEWGLGRGTAEQVIAETLASLVGSIGKADSGEAGEALPRYLLERVENLRRGDRVWTRPLPPALS